MRTQHHEDFRRDTHGPGPSDRNFGGVFTAVFLIFGVWPLLHGKPVRPAWLIVSAAVLALTLARPSLLHPANRVWTGLGRAIGKVMNPIVTGLLFYLVFTPCALILRCAGKDLLGRKRLPEAETYWIRRTAADEASSMLNQF